MIEHSVKSKTGDFERKVWLLCREGAGPRKLCIFLDAEYYLDKVGAPAIIERLQEEGAVPPVAAVFVSNLDNAARHADFICNPSYARFVAEDLVSWTKAKVRGD